MGIVAIGRIENVVVALVFLVETWIGEHRGDREEQRKQPLQEMENASVSDPSSRALHAKVSRISLPVVIFPLRYQNDAAFLSGPE